MTEKIGHFLSVSDFQCGQHPFPEFTLHADQIEFDDNVKNNVVLAANYNRHMNLTLTYRDNSANINLFGQIDTINLRGKNYPKPVELIATKTVIKNSGTEIIFIPKFEPLLVDFGQPAIKIEAIIMNGPEIIWSDQNLDFSHGDYLLCLSEFKTTKELRDPQRKLNREYIATGKITLQHKENNPIEPEVAFQKLTHLDRFLTFARGARCGIGNINGQSADGSNAFTYLGFSSMDQFKVTTGWCDLGVVKSLPDIYQRYTQAVAIENDKRPLLATMEFYRASNVTRGTSLEMAIVASHAALETIVPHLLKTKAGWSTNLLKNREISFHDKLRAAIQFVGLSVDPLEHLVALQARSKQLSNADAYEVVSIFRNRIVHQSKPFNYGGAELIEVWNLSQWLCEILLFFWFNYRGDMNDRRQQSGWRGEMIKSVPLH